MGEHKWGNRPFVMTRRAIRYENEPYKIVTGVIGSGEAVVVAVHGGTESTMAIYIVLVWALYSMATSGRDHACVRFPGARTIPLNLSMQKYVRLVRLVRINDLSDKCGELRFGQRLRAGYRSQFSLLRRDNPPTATGQTKIHPRPCASWTTTWGK